MRVVILAAGKGTRMGALTEELPKALLFVRGKTFLEHIISALPSEVGEVLIVIGYRGEQIRAFLGRHFLGKRITYIVNDSLEKGNAHSLLLTRGHFRRSERFALIYADELPSKSEMKKCFSHEFSWLTREVHAAGRFSSIVVSPRGDVLAVQEKPARRVSRTVPSGVLVVNADIFDCAPRRHEDGECYVTDMMAAFVQTHSVKAVTGTQNVYFSTPADIDRFNKRGKMR